MQKKRAVIIRCEWETVPDGWTIPPLIPDATLVQMFSETPGHWSVAQLWRDATLGQMSFDPAMLVDVGKLTGLSITRQPDGSTTNPNRAAVITAAKAAAEANGIAFGPADVPVAFISPPPSDAGGWGSTCELDVGGDHSFMAHEFGHAIGFNHSWGPAFGNPDSEYCDPYCVMSHDIHGYRSPWADAWPPSEAVPPGIPAGWTVQMGPLPAAATVWKYLPDFATAPCVAEFDLTHPPSRLSLISYGAAFSPSNMILGIARTAANTWFVEHRGSHGWDRGIGLGPKFNPGANGMYDPTPPGIVIHRLDPAGNVVFVDVIDERNGAPQLWSASDDAFTVQLRSLSADGRMAEVEVGPARLTQSSVGTETTEFGVAVAAVNGTFVAEHAYLAWAGSGNHRVNVARSDDADHHVAHDDTALDHVALASDGNTVWTVWTGTNPGHNLNVYAGTPGDPFAAKIVRGGDSSPSGPAAALFNGQLAIAYRGNDGGLYVTLDGAAPGSPATRIGTEATSLGPAISTYGGRLYVAWIGTDGQGTINLISSADGHSWDSKWTLWGQSSRYTPALLGSDPGRVYVAWTGMDGGQSLNLGYVATADLGQANPNGAFADKLTYPTGSAGAPGLATTTSGADLVLAWPGRDGPGRLHVAYISFPFAPPPPVIH